MCGKRSGIKIIKNGFVEPHVKINLIFKYLSISIWSHNILADIRVR